MEAETQTDVQRWSCRQFLATGGTNPADCQIMRINDSMGASTSEPSLTPVQTLVVGLSVEAPLSKHCRL